MKIFYLILLLFFNFTLHGQVLKVREQNQLIGLGINLNQLKINDTHVQQNLQAILKLDRKRKINKTLGKTESIKKFLLVCETWSPENGALSPTLKLKRKALKTKYKIKLDYLYGYTDENGNLLKRNEDGTLVPKENN